MHHAGYRGPYAPRLDSSLSALREAAFLTQAELAKLAGISERSVRQHEVDGYGGKRWRWTHSKLERICRDHASKVKAEGVPWAKVGR